MSCRNLFPNIFCVAFLIPATVLMFCQQCFAFKQKDQNFLDKIFYERPNVPKTFNGYEYPKSYIGFQGIYNVFEFLCPKYLWILMFPKTCRTYDGKTSLAVV